MKLIALILAGMVLVGCNTVQGLGKDIQQGGHKLEKAADR
ncbi:MAG: entericidin [Gallionellaceae bacterium CG1_02_56_997]|nr:entericidin A/B family lipoprotein [Gallionella sp.]OIO82503.1 MAG: entericidin [Gallionellaceae bacterium CG1_02_56_997]PIV15507.1 MAG: entericidin [Gallionellales bacterium CG03_land_8_20_14_0_80_55_15]PIV91656.1 MAG: entericidin [Gallionellales bacterium CG17_big_fil_post_rev_8_21_14_2_50_54_146]PIX05604.1 MAG: entericidin [Gallionellales bacterium CG_4_8_14_3_um_filter_54_18]PJC03986.1 MAG: entericidin [Gallionellales bacterium CG_4_9_14_0_8_um_filter_55_61]